MKKIIGRIIFLIALVGLVFSGYKLFLIWKDYQDNSNLYSSLQDLEPAAAGDFERGGFKFTGPDYDKLYGINSNFIGWISIPNTMINYPVVQPKDKADDYYLTHNFENSQNSGGAIFVEQEILHPFEDENTIIHGHHMRDGSMFAALNNYKEEDFFKNNNKIYIITKDNCYTYQIFSVYVEKANDNPYRYSFKNKDEYISYLNDLKNKSLFLSDIDNFTENDKIITLSTCSYEYEDGRCLVHAKLISKEQY